MVEAYAHPTRANRIKLAALLGGWFAAFLLFGKIWIPIAQPHLNAGGCAALSWMHATVVMFSVLLLIPAVFCARSAFLMAKTRVSPFPGAWVPFRTPIQTGFRAISHALVHAIFSLTLTLAVSCIWFFYFYACGPTLSCGC